MKVLVLILTTVFITACDHKVYSYEIEGYLNACENRGGVAYINNLTRAAVCKTGELVNFNTDKGVE
jgi:hypothetical protein